MTEHTPGPWRIVIDGTCSGAWPHIVGPDFEGNDTCAGEAIAELGTCFVERRMAGMPGTYSEKPRRFRKTRDHDQVMANARLVARAPMLLAELQNIANAKRFDRTVFEDDTSFVDWAQSRARAAIANVGSAS